MLYKSELLFLQECSSLHSQMKPKLGLLVESHAMHISYLGMLIAELHLISVKGNALSAQESYLIVSRLPAWFTVFEHPSVHRAADLTYMNSL